MTTYSYDPATDAGKVRLLCTDTAVTDAELRIFSDEEVAAFLSLAADGVLYAAAFALETIAASEVLIQKRLTLLDLKTDGPAEADALRALATSYRDQAAADPDDLPDWAELVTTGWSEDERISNEWVRTL